MTVNVLFGEAVGTGVSESVDPSIPCPVPGVKVYIICYVWPDLHSCFDIATDGDRWYGLRDRVTDVMEDGRVNAQYSLVEDDTIPGYAIKAAEAAIRKVVKV